MGTSTTPVGEEPSTTPVQQTKKKCPRLPRGYRSNRRPDLSEEEKVTMRRAELLGKTTTGVVIQTGSRFFLRWNRRRTDTVYLPFSELERILGADRQLWVGAKLTCSISGLVPSNVLAYQQHPTCKTFELIAPATQRRPLGQVRQQQSRQPNSRPTGSPARVSPARSKSRSDSEGSWRRK